MPKDKPSVGSRIFLRTDRKTLYLHIKDLVRVGFIAIAIMLLGSTLPGASSRFAGVEVAEAQTPNTTVNFQARILQASGSLVPDGNYHIEFKVYNDISAGATAQGVCSGNCLWMETRTTGNLVRVVNGYVSVNLGSVTAFPASMPWADNLYVTMRVGGNAGAASWDTEMTNAGNRMKTNVAPIAFTSNNVASSNTNAASANSSNISIQTGNALGTTSTSGNISINTGSGTTNSGNISIDAGNGAVTDGTITLGAANASALTLGRTGLTTSNTGALSVTQLLTAAGNLSITGGTTNGVYFRDASGNVVTTAAGTSGQCFRATTAAAPSFGSCSGTGDILQDGNSFGAGGVIIGSNDAFNLNFETNNITRLTIDTSGNATLTGNLTVGSAAGVGLFTNNGATVNSTLAIGNLATGGTIGTAAATVDVYTSVSINQTTTGQTITLPTPTANTTYGRTVYLSNIGTASFTLLGNVVAPGNAITAVWSNTTGGASWQTSGTAKSGGTAGTVSTAASGGASGAIASKNPYGADYINTSTTSAQTVINTALATVGAGGGGTVYLMEGTYIVDGAITIPNNTTLAGSVSGTVIKIKNSTNAAVDVFTNTDTATGEQVILRDLVIDGNKSNQTSGTMNGAYFTGIGSGTGASAKQGVTVNNVTAKNLRSNGIYLLNTNNSSITNSKAQNNDNNGINASNSSRIIVANNTSFGNANIEIVFSIGDSSSVTGNIVDNTGGFEGIFIEVFTNGTVTSNNVFGGGSTGILVTSSAGPNIVANNTIKDVTGTGINISSSDYSLVTGNTITNTGGTTTNRGIIVLGNYNKVENNIITDNSCTSTCIAISVSSGSNNYLADNRHTGTAANPSTITDAGTNTIYASQLTSAQILQSSSTLIRANSSSSLTGTGAITATSAAVTGTSTLFTTQLQVGDRITINGETRTVTVITSATALTVDTAFTTTASLQTITRLPASLVVQNSAGATQLIVSDSGNVGIGTSAPGARLEITGGTGTAVGAIINNGTSTGNILNLQDNGINVLTVADGGNVSANGQLLLNGTGSNQSQLIVRANTGQTVANPLVLLQNSSSVELARINATTTSLYFGNAAGGSSAAGVNNTGIGASALGAVSTGTANTTLGSGALASVSVNNNNTAVGYNAGNLATGGNNIFLGALAGDNVTTGTDNIIIGYNLDASAVGATNELRIGGVLQGNTSTLAAQFNGTLAVTTLGSADTNTFVCRNSSSQLATCSSTPLTNSLTDNIPDAYDLQEGTNNYININTTNTTENISFGNAVTNPSYNFLGSGTLAVAGSQTVGGNLDVAGTIFAGTADAFQVSTAGAVTAVGVNSGTGLIQGTGGLTVTGAVTNLNVSSNFATNINTGTSTGAVTIGNSAAGAIALQSASTIGLTGTTTITGLSAGAATALTVNNSTSTGNILNLQDNGIGVLTVADGGAVVLQNFTNSTAALRINDTAGTKVLSVDTTSSDTRLEVIGNIVSKGTAWTGRSAAAANSWKAVAYGNGLFVAVAYSGTNNRVMTSPDGVNWTAQTTTVDNQWYALTYGNGLFVAVAYTGTGNRVMTSPDGITWTSRTSAADNPWTAVTYGNGLFVAVAESGTDRVMTSPDGINWTSRSAAAANLWQAVTYGNGLFVAVANSGTGNRVMTSPDGITWTSRTSAADSFWKAVTYGNGLFVAVAESGTDRVMTSPDGINWTSRSAAAANFWQAVTYGNGLFVAVATTGTGNRVMTSPDGITWTSRTSAADNGWLAVTYGNGQFVSVAFSGASNRVMTSGKTETIPFSANNTYQGGQTVYGNALFKSDANSTTAFQVQSSGSATPILNVDSTNSRVGIGTAGGTGKLTVTGATSALGLFESTGANHAYFTVKAPAAQQAGILFNTGNADRFSLGVQTDNSFFLYDNAGGRDAFNISGGNVTVNGVGGSVTVGNTVGANATTIAAGSGSINLNSTQAQFTEVTGTRTLTVQTRSTSIAGTNLAIQAGQGGTGAGFIGGALTLQGGTAGGTNANGGNVSLVGGVGTGTGVKGLVVIDTATYSASSVQNFTGSAAITQSNINGFGTILISSNAAGYTATLSDPTTVTAGRLVYVTNTGLFDITLSANAGLETITLKPNTSATMLWNGADWTAAGASSATDLQAAYDNTATSAGGAELVLNAAGGAADGLTIRNNATTPIVGGLLEVQTSIGSNLFTVNNNATEYANNGGAESSTFTMWTDAFAGGTVTRNTTVSNAATGQASVQVVTAAIVGHGAENTLSTTLTPNLKYAVSYTVKGATNFATLETVFSRDGTNTATTSCNSAQTVTSSQFTRINCTFTAPSSGITAANSIFIRQTDGVVRTFYIDNLSVTVSADVNHAADGSVDSALGTNWTDFGANTSGTTAAVRNTTVLYDTSGSVEKTTGATADRGIINNLVINPSVSTQYLVTFYARSSNAFNDIRVRYSRDGGTSFESCVDYNTQVVSTTTYTKITCIFTTDGTTPTNADLVIDQPTATARTFYVDALTVTLNTNNSNNVQVGGGSRGGPATLFTLDRSAGNPIAANNDAYLGSMYYDTASGRIQCYEADGWGACGAAPDNIVNLNPEYAGAVLNGSGVGTMTADFCAEQAGVLNINTALCDVGQAKNYYKWTSPQATQQTYSIYVTYQLPATFNGFSSDDTVQLIARSDSLTNAAVTYEMFKSTGSAVTACGTETTVVTTSDTWQSVGVNGNEATGCSFNSSSAGNFVIFKINMKANSNANAYVSTLSFVTTGR